MIPTFTILLIAIAIVFFLGTTALMVWFIGCNEKARWRHILSALFCWRSSSSPAAPSKPPSTTSAK